MKPQTNLKVLIVEDSAEDHEMIVRELLRSGYVPEAKRVDNATDFRAALAEDGVQLVISDYLLPGFDAATALQICKETGCEIPFIIVSGVMGEEKVVEMMWAGARDHILKQNLFRLGAAVSRELEAASSRRRVLAPAQDQHPTGISAQLRRCLTTMRSLIHKENASTRSGTATSGILEHLDRLAAEALSALDRETMHPTLK